MVRNHIRLQLRQFAKNKVHFFVNIAGLAAGITVALLTGLWIRDELSFDHFHQHHDRLAQVLNTQVANGEMKTGDLIPIPVAAELRAKYSADFQQVALCFQNYTHIVAVGEKKISSSGVWSEARLPRMLSLHMLRGNVDALEDPSSVLLTESLATALFGKDDPINKLVRVDNMTEVKVAGVFEDLPHNSTFYDTKLFLSWKKALTVMTWMKDYEERWDVPYWKLYVQLQDHVSMKAVNEKVRNLIRDHVKGDEEEVMLHPMNKWHLYSEFQNGKIAGGRIRYVWMFGIIGVFVLLLACINFMNLSTARSERRAKEVGVRKVVGSLRSQLIFQFIGESLLLTTIAFVIAVIMTVLLLPAFNNLTDKSIAFPAASPLFLLTAIGFIGVVGSIAGSYPAFYLSGIRPVSALKGSWKAGRTASLPRKFLVVLQFTVSIALIIGTIIVYRQIQHARNRPPGYDREGLLSIHINTPELYNVPYNVLRNTLLESGGAKDMAESDISSVNAPFTLQGIDWKEKARGTSPTLGLVQVTHDFGSTVGWKFIAGRDFSRSFITDSGSLIINESALKLFGFFNPVGEIITWDGQQHRIIGVVRDMVMESPFKTVQAGIFLLSYNSNFITLRVNPGLPIRQSLARIAQVFRRLNPASPFEYSFVDEDYAHKFSDEERIGNLATVFAVLAVFISCLGLFGLASFVAEQRLREIGIRKVLGATVAELWGLLCREFVLLVLLSCFLSIPATFFLMREWLQHYEYRTTIPWWIFPAAGMGALLLAFATVSFQSIKAAMTNPARVLKSE